MVCQVCGKTWPADQTICPNDGTWLHEQTVMEQQRQRARTSPTIEPPPLGDPPTHNDHGRPFARTAAAMPFPAPVAPVPGPVAPIGAPAAAPLPAPPEGPPGLLTELGAGVRVGEYEIEAKIGEGAMGTVYRAVHPAIGRHVAIKVMTPKLFDQPESVKRFVAEARAVAAIRHPGIVDVFGFGRLPDNRTYLVMEWLDGTSLSMRLAHGKLSLEEACDMLRQIARALEAAHAKGIVHRDLKPDNVFVHHIDDEKPQCKLLDFGLAKVTNQDDNAVAVTRTGQLLGTPLYMSPEQCKSKGVDHRTDIYALGCMAYEMLCGRVPFDADNVAELISSHLVTQPPQPASLNPQLPPALDKLLLQMVSKNPDERPTLAEVRRVLSAVITRTSQLNVGMRAEDLTPPPPAGPALGMPPGFLTGSSPGIPLAADGTPSGGVAAVPLPVAVPAPPAKPAARDSGRHAPDLEEGTLMLPKPVRVPWTAVIVVLSIIATTLALILLLR